MSEAPTNVGNFKGVMLCSRPAMTEPVRASADRSAQAGDRHAFISTIVPPEKLGLNPIKKFYPASRTVKLPSDNVTWRHKRWLSDFQNQRKQMNVDLETEKFQKDEQKRQFSERAAKMRAEIRSTEVVVIKPEKKNNEKMQEPRKPIVKEPENLVLPEVAIPKPRTPAKRKPKPAWALSDKQNDEVEEDEVDDLLDFTKNLDLDQFLDDMEVREALKFVKKKVEDTERKERLYAPRENYGKEDGEEDDEDKENQDRLPPLPRRALEAASRMSDRPEWNDSMRTDEMRTASVLEEGGSRMKHVHSTRSMRAVMERVAERPLTQLSAPPRNVLSTTGDQVVQLGVEPPIIAMNGEGGNRGEVRPSNLPFLYRHPAV